ncbi:M61 family metallopeptidase [Chitinophaga sp. CF418]|uniref:M61 family metallopeptidase n=1 Tax=Chitinophaga sp. CF418 TaxID=1855287 RepID=UPI00165EFC89|nr:M61 family metallopeptidase [Chitinophaga sp. CF418]
MCLFFLASNLASAQEMTYTVSPVLSDTPYFHIELSCGGFSADSLQFSIPEWTPGYYQLMDYASAVRNLHATDANGNTLSWKKAGKNGWWIYNKSVTPIVHLQYDVLSTKLFVASNHLEADQAFISPAGMFMHLKARVEQPVTLVVKPVSGWNVATGLTPVPDKQYTYIAPDFDVLYDSPILMGKLETFPSFEVQGKPHHFVAYRPREFDRAAFMKDLQKIISTAADIIGDIPYDNYTFLGIGPGMGGIEHLNSTAVSFTGNNLNNREGKIGTYNFLAHEYFHHYNVKRIRPIELGPFDYDHGSKTRLLWISEGFTVYYEYIILRRAGLTTQDDVLKGLQDNIHSYESKPGRLIQSAAAASYNTWSDGPFGSGDSSISYYEKGPVLGALLDLKIRHETRNKRSLDDVMRALYREYYQDKKRGFTEAEFKAVAERIAGVSLTEYFEYANTVKMPDYKKYFGYAGLDVTVKDGSFAITRKKSRNALQESILKDWLR